MSRAAKRGTVFHGTEWDWRRGPDLTFVADVGDMEAGVYQVRNEGGLLVWVGVVGPEGEVAASIRKADGFHSPTAAMRELEQLAAEL